MSLLADPYFWMAVGFAGQGLFTARFLVQWLASERSGEVVVPTSFWWLSILGAFALLSYAISRRDPVVILGQSTGFVVYVRNLMLGKGRKGSKGDATGPATHAPHFRAAEAAGPALSRVRDERA
jgi:lipid-A-disaccharide synthase-like uncharacterized protein